MPPPIPPAPPQTPAEIEGLRQISAALQELAEQQQRANLQVAVRLAQQALCGQGPLVEHFAELGRRFAALLDTTTKPTLRLVPGGRP
jgi:hypothetical protein